MFYEVKTQSGTIALDRAVLGQIIRREAGAFRGKVVLASAKGKPVGDDIGFFDCAWSEGAFELRVCVVLRFGTSISAVTHALIRRLRSRIEALTGIRASRITIAVKGMLSKNISRRDLEIIG
ncbi:MAG: Asp23/Gls24 family envelope stress response protein [Clostridiales Family XIII bacterium]|jgi:uncharacterized alkaline shock family protein YloU|nr:Asp23/Gls24 family envelope stress response protein [Clostridiales Family XIII bacterium]